jgi:hypothetical protein
MSYQPRERAILDTPASKPDDITPTHAMWSCRSAQLSPPIP